MLAITETAISGRIATTAHTIRLMLILLFLAAGSLLFRWHLESLRASSVHPSENHVAIYVSVIASEWMLFRGVRAGIRRAGMNWCDLAGASAFDSS